MTADSAKQRGRTAGVRYLPVGRFFLNAETGLVRAWRLLWEQQNDFLGSEGKQVGNDDVARRDPVGRTVGTTKLMLRYLYARFGGAARVITLPLRGDLAIERLSGAVKLLDLESRKVYTIMGRNGSSDKLAERITSTRRVADRAFAPRFEGADLEQGWLAEEFVAGEHPTGFRGCRERFGEYYLPLLVEFLRAEPPRTVSLAEHVTSLRSDIFAPGALLWRLEPELRGEITSFVEAVVGRLSGTPRFSEGTVSLTLSHGDFFSGNVILVPGGAPRAIDWATSGTRSPLHDLYYLLMNHCVRVMSPSERLERFSTMLDELRRRLQTEAPESFAVLDQSLVEARELRWLFYLECVHVPLMHCASPEDRYIRSLATRIGWFKEFERAVEDDDSQP